MPVDVEKGLPTPKKSGHKTTNPDTPPITKELIAIRSIQKDLGFDQKDMADMLGCSLVGYKRFASGSRKAPAYIARFVIALQVLNERHALKQFVDATRLYLGGEQSSEGEGGGV